MVLAGRGSLRGKGLEMAWGARELSCLATEGSLHSLSEPRGEVESPRRAAGGGGGMFRITVLCTGEQTQGWRLHSAMLTLGDMLRPSEGLWVIVWE